MADVDYSKDVFTWVSPEAEAKLGEKALYLDMDGTIADLYSVPDWLPKLENSDPEPYAQALPRCDMSRVAELRRLAASRGWRFGIVSWLSKEADADYARRIIDAKLGWCKRHLPRLDEIVFAPYGLPKSQLVGVRRNAILIDDEQRNLDEWADAASGRVALRGEDVEAALAAAGRAMAAA